VNDFLKQRLTDPIAAKHWKSYLKSLRNYRSHALMAEWDAFEEDIELHVLDCLNHATEGLSQEDIIRSAIDSLGPADRIAQDFLSQASPLRGGKASGLTMQGVEAGVSLLRAVLLSAATVFAVMGMAHLVNQDVGLWLHGRGDWTLSFERQTGATQLFRETFSVFAVAFSILLIWLWRLLGSTRDAGQR
jgi:hypothetical protein